MTTGLAPPAFRAAASDSLVFRHLQQRCGVGGLVPRGDTLLLLHAGAVPASWSGVRLRARDGSFAVTAGELGNGDGVRQWFGCTTSPTNTRTDERPTVESCERIK